MNKKFIFQKISKILFILLLSSCSLESIRPTKNPLKEMKDSLQNASPDFRQGWYDGCEVGMASGANSFYKMFYRSNQQDGWKMSSPEYKSAWNKAFWYCVHTAYVDSKSPIYGSAFRGLQ